MHAINKLASPLSRSSTLVSVNVGTWTARKLDRKITQEVNSSHGASADAGRYNKLLLQKDRLKPITTLAHAARACHYKYTKPWADEGPRILPNALYDKFTNEFRNIKRDWQPAVDEFVRGYPGFVEERKRELNGLFNSADYPKAGEIADKFQLGYTFLPFPDANDFRSDLPEEIVEDIRREISEGTGKVVDDAMKHTVSQIFDTVGHMARKLAEYKSDPDRKTFFQDSLVDNVRELADLLPAFNLTNDPRLTEVATRIARELCVEDAKTLRDNDAAREVVQKSATDIVATMNKLFG